MKQITLGFFLLLFPIYTFGKINNFLYATYSREEMQEFRNKCKEKMQSNSMNLKDRTYQMARALRTLSGDDCDYIPKVVGAGEIFNDAGIAYQLMHNGVKVLLNSYYDVQWITDVIYGLKGHHEPQEEKCFYEVLKYIPENATMIELGSYWAYYSLWFALEIKNTKNYLIEPNPKNLEIGKNNFALNNTNGFFLRGYAGEVVEDCYGAELVSIDDFIEREGIEHVNILHSDIQGGEREMLKTCIRNLDKIDYFFISTHGLNTYHNPCIDFLTNHGFTIIAEHSENESHSGDGLIVAKRIGVYGPEQINITKYK